METSTIPSKVRIRREIPPSNNLKLSEMNVAEMDLTARVVVFPLVELHLSNESPNDNKGNLT